MTNRGEWRAPTLVLLVSWAAVTLVLVACAMRVPLPSVVRIVPFVLAGYVTGRRFPSMSSRSRWIAAGTLGVVSAIFWSAFTFATTPLPHDRALLLMLASLPICAFAALWTLAAMRWATPRVEAPAAVREVPGRDVDALERELREELEREAKGA
jgi:hypothetical protein